ncbi:MAG: hypothetical protein RIC55_11080 [Pirellulaceae bacterium]
MSILSMLLIVAALAAPDEAKPSDEVKTANPRLQVRTAIEDGIRLLEAKEFKTFIERYAHPMDLKKILKEKSVDELAKEFQESNAEKLLVVLQMIRRDTPEMSEDGRQAVFKLKAEGLPRDGIRYEKSGDFWYIRN